MAKQLNAGERNLLTYPPTKDTWECGRKTRRLDIGPEGTPVEVTTTCLGVMSGRYKSCTFCRQPKRSAARLLWPLYVAACAKARIEPGTRWPPRAEPTEAARPTKRKGA